MVPAWYGISDDEHDEFKKIGNLTLLEDDPNIRTSNRSLEKKQEFYTEEKTDFNMTHELFDVDEWGVDEIQQRSNDLAGIVAGVWSI